MAEPISTDQLRLIYDNTGDLIFLLEVTPAQDFRVLSVNQSFLKATGFNEDAIVHRDLKEIYPKVEYDYLVERYRETIRSGRAKRYETRTQLHGNTIYVETMLVPFFDNDGHCTNLIGVSRDVTRRKHEKRALLEAKKRAENYLDISEAMIIALDTDCKLTMINRKGYQVLGYPEGSLIGKDWCELTIKPGRREEYMRGFREFVQGGVPRKHINYLVTSKGEQLLIRSQNSFIYDENGKITGVMSSGEDISDRKRAEQALIANQRALAAEEVVTAVAHDFNNSLQGIIGSIEVAMAEAGLPVEAKRALTAASNLAEDAAGRIKALNPSGVTSSESAREVVSINSIVAEVVEESRHLWKDLAERVGRQIKVDVDLAAESAAVRGSKSELRSVLYNIIKNAIEAIETRGTLQIITQANDNQATILVKDNGSGMDADVAARAFQAFFSTKGMEAGRGLGLAACYSIVRSHGGDIRILETEPGEGTTIALSLPLATEAAASEDESLPESHQNHTVLWVDDDPSVRLVATGFLEVLEVSFDVVEDGHAAIEKFRDNHYSMVITDIGMQGMSGTELAGVLRQQNADVPIIAITGWGDAALDGIDNTDAITGVLGKPIRLRDLKDLLAEYPVASLGNA